MPWILQQPNILYMVNNRCEAKAVYYYDSMNVYFTSLEASSSITSLSYTPNLPPEKTNPLNNYACGFIGHINLITIFKSSLWEKNQYFQNQNFIQLLYILLQG